MPAKTTRMRATLPSLSSRKGVIAPVTDHKFAVGQAVRLLLPLAGIDRSPDTYRIVKLLPKDVEGHQYRIKSDSETYERVARESQLKARS